MNNGMVAVYPRELQTNTGHHESENLGLEQHIHLSISIPLPDHPSP